VCALLCLLGVATCVFGQSDVASVTGRVMDPNGAIIIEATVAAKNVDTGVETRVQTNEEGIYHFASLTPGNYEFTVSKRGFKEILKPGVTLHLADTISMNFNMVVGEITEKVTVEAGATMVNTTDASISTVVDQTYVKNMPLNGRSFQDLILLSPGVVTGTPQNSGLGGLGQTGEFSVNGQRTEENYYTVDGVSANIGATGVGGLMTAFGGASGSVSASTALGTTQSLVSIDDLQEFRIQSSTYSAEYGRNPGAQIGFETKSGTNQWHGTAYDYLRSNYFDANDWFNDFLKVPEPPLRQNDFGATFGGPARLPHLYNGKDKTFFHVSYEGLRLLQPQPAFQTWVPDNALRASTVAPLNQVLNAFPVQNCTPVQTCDDTANGVAQYTASWSNPSTINTGSVRLDHAVNDKLRFFFRFSDTDSGVTARQGSATSSGTPSNTDTSAVTTRTYTGGVNSFFTSRLSNELRLNYSTNHATDVFGVDKFGGNTPIDFAQITGLGPKSFTEVPFILGNHFIFLDQGPNIGEQRQWNLVDTVSYSVGRHQLKFGADYRRLTPYQVIDNPVAFYDYTQQTVAQVQANEADVAFFQQFLPAYPLFTNFSLFAQDSWKVTPRLTLDMGLRWEVNPAAGATQGLHGNTLVGTGPDNWTVAPQGTPLWKTTWYNFAPRLGAAYLVRSVPGWETVVRGGGGLYFDTAQQLGGSSFGGPGFSAENDVSGVAGLPSFPCQPTPPATTCNPADSVPAAVFPPPPYSPGQFFSLHGFYPHLQLPYTLQWTASLEQGLGRSQALTVSYVGSHAGRLLQQEIIDASSSATAIASEFAFVQNGKGSDYNALQTQFQRRLSQGLTALASYTWSHCLDYGSQNFFHGYEKGSCDVDARHNLSAAFSYDLPNVGHGGLMSALAHHWGIDDRLIARTAFPVDLMGAEVFDPATQRRFSNGLDFTGQPIYIYGSQCDAEYAAPCPGGRAINPAAFMVTTSSTGIGAVPRNFARGGGAWQMNLAVRKEFPFYERMKLQFRAEAFNILNHPNFGVIDTGCSADPMTGVCQGVGSTFGQYKATLANSLGIESALYQMGGARSMQFALRLTF
jgi:hypothetical protein